LRLRINELQNDIRGFAKTGTWAAVLAADAELTKLDPEASDPDGLATKARAELLEAELASSYAKGVKQLDEHDWTGAEETFGVLLDRRGGYRDADGLLALARRQGRPEVKHQPPHEPLASKPVPTGSAPQRGEVGRLATPAAERRQGLNSSRQEPKQSLMKEEPSKQVQRPQHESRKYGRWMILPILAGLLVVATIITVAVVNSNTNPTEKLLSHLPAAERSTCRGPETPLSGESELAIVSCSTGSYSLWGSRADAKWDARRNDPPQGDCLRRPPPDPEPGAYQYWSKNGMSVVLSCVDVVGDFHVYWSIDQLRISGHFWSSHFSFFE
jgi:hypothetical protein